MHPSKSSRNHLKLHPDFNHCQESVTVTADVTRVANSLNIVFQVSGNIAELTIPAITTASCRKNDLWQTTCFECFFRGTRQEGYWELNVSPNGYWNLYRFSGYRQGMEEERSVAAINYRFSQQEGSLTLTCTLPIDTLIAAEQELAIGLSCVLAYTSGKKDFWSLHHPTDKPDFHHPGGMVLTLRP